MRPETHARVINICGYVVLVIGILLFFSIFILAQSQPTGFKLVQSQSTEAKVLLLFIVLILIFIVIPLILRNLPVHCNKPGCNGRMKITEKRKSISTVQIRYHCHICGNNYRADTFSLKSGRGVRGGGGGK